MEWAADNWIFIASILYAAASEIIGASPLKSNTVVGTILLILGRFLGKKNTT